MQNRLFLSPGMFEDTVFDSTEIEWVRSVLFGIIGLAAVSFFLTMIFLFTYKLWKRQITTRTFKWV